MSITEQLVSLLEELQAYANDVAALHESKSATRADCSAMFDRLLLLEQRHEQLVERVFAGEGPEGLAATACAIDDPMGDCIQYWNQLDSDTEFRLMAEDEDYEEVWDEAVVAQMKRLHDKYHLDRFTAKIEDLPGDLAQ